MDIQKIFKNNEIWVEGKLRSDKDYFKKLSVGQSPEILYIGCSDSRVTAEEIMGVGPGDAFVHRNIANMVVGGDLNIMSVINYAAIHLKVKHIVVCGHYGCGGINAAMGSTDLGILNPWLQNIRDVYRTHKKILNDIQDEKLRHKKLVELNVEEQCINLYKMNFIQKAVLEREIKVHGWVFDMGTGKLIDLNIDLGESVKDIAEVYKLK